VKATRSCSASERPIHHAPNSSVNLTSVAIAYSSNPSTLLRSGTIASPSNMRRME